MTMVKAALIFLASTAMGASSYFSYLLHSEFLGGKSTTEWKLLYIGTGTLSAALLSRAVAVFLGSPGVNGFSDLAFFAGSAVLCTSCFIFWNKFRV